LPEVCVKKIMAVAASAAAMLLLGSAAPLGTRAGTAQPVRADAATAAAAAADPFAAPAELAWAPEPPVPPSTPPPPPEPPTPGEALADGVLIVVSIPSQRLYVFRAGDLWDSSKVSTGRRGHETPTGTFPILQKKVDHRSTLYDDAPMPFMQRLTWGGVALHAGRVPGYPASHGCIRLPRAFAKKLYGVTRASTTAVIVTDAPLGSAKAALEVV
jgi:lipoprotein-anchoring transpeptidase ErfK/SrfK